MSLRDLRGEEPIPRHPAGSRLLELVERTRVERHGQPGTSIAGEPVEEGGAMKAKGRPAGDGAALWEAGRLFENALLGNIVRNRGGNVEAVGSLPPPGPACLPRCRAVTAVPVDRDGRDQALWRLAARVPAVTWAGHGESMVRRATSRIRSSTSTT